MARHHHLHPHHHDADQPDTPTIRGRPRHSEDGTPETDDEPRTEETLVNIVDELPRSGLVIFDDCVSLVHVHSLPERALNRWREEEQQHQQGPQGNQDDQDDQPQRSQIPPAIYDGSAPVLSSRNLTQVSRACIVAANGFYVVNCDTSGPQVNICWRVPGPRNIWLARLAASPDGSDTGHTPSIIPGMTLSCFRRGASGVDDAWEWHHPHTSILNLNNPSLATMDAMHRDRYRITKTRPPGKGEKKRPQASENVEHGPPTRPEATSQSINTQDQSQTPRVHAPLRGEATRQLNPQRDTSQYDTGERKRPQASKDAQNQAQAPSPDGKPPSEASQGDDENHDDENQDHDPNLQDFRPIVLNYNLLRILPAVDISSDPTLSIRNPRETGPQNDICARVPGWFNHWAARVSCYDSFDDFRDLIVMHSGVESLEVHLYLSTFGASYTYNRDLVAQELILDEPSSIIAWTNDPDPGFDLSQATMFGSTSCSTTPLLPYIQHVLGEKGSKWLV
ncbi:hypothetical protein F52700_6281 [Fusarium sp. NRRL 52700]|nr:hypothetical protein F52700_6281 [Fusarium sp. NRRL 52700]